MRNILFAIGLVLLLLGLLFVGQGTGYFPYPSYSFMISDIGWAWRGAAVALAGIAFIFISPRM